MDLSAADRCLRCKDADLGHQIVTDLALDRERGVDVDVVGVRAQIVEFGLRDEAGPLLRFGERDPHGAPQLAALAFGEELAQRRAPVSPRERRGVSGVVHGPERRLRGRKSIGLDEKRREGREDLSSSEE